MGYAPVNRRSVRCRLASLLLLAALAGGAAWADPGRTVLVFPAESPWPLQATAEAVTTALPEALQQAGYAPIGVQPDSPFVQQAMRDGWAGLEKPVAPTSARLSVNAYVLARYARADATLAAVKVASTGEETELEAALADPVGQQPAVLRVTAKTREDPRAVGRELAQKLVAAITPELWAKLGTDADSRRQAAATRATAGEASMQRQQWRQAAMEFEAAVAGDPGSVAYLTASARALQAAGSPELALARATRAAQLAPDDPAQQQLVGELALEAGRYRQAETVFEGLLENEPDDPVAIEGLARALRGDGDTAGAKREYARLIALLPALHDEPSLLAGALATLETDSVRLAGATPDQLDLALARVYFEAGEGTEGVRVLHRYHAGGERPAYADADYEVLAQGLDAEATAIALEAEQALRRAREGEEGAAEARTALEAIHTRSDQLADVGEWMEVSPRLDRGHRFRVLAFNALNESNYEAQQYVQSREDSHRRRAAVLREASRTALREAEGGDEGLGTRD